MIKIFIIATRLYISYFEPLFARIVKIIGSPDKMMTAHFFIQNCFKSDCYYYKVFSVTMTITLMSIVACDNTQI